jgi:hypothetical protein
MLEMTDGIAAPAASMRNASRTDDLPLLFLPVIRLTIPNPSILSFRNDRKCSMERLVIIGFITLSSVNGDEDNRIRPVFRLPAFEGLTDENLHVFGRAALLRRPRVQGRAAALPYQ